MLQTHTFKITWIQTKYAPDTAPTKHSKTRVPNPRVLQRTERLLEEGPAAVGVALKVSGPLNGNIINEGRDHQTTNMIKTGKIVGPRAWQNYSVKNGI